MVNRMKKSAGIFWNIFSMLIGMLIIYFLGSLQLSLVAKMSFHKTLAIGVLPFIPGDIIKVLLAAIISSRLKGRIKV
jgi:biotin transport system substrate-specific component